MPTIHLHETTEATPEQLVAALTDFGPGRSKIFENSADDQLEVHDQGREGKNLRGRFLGVVLGTVGRGVLPNAFANNIAAIEARNDAPERS